MITIKWTEQKKASVLKAVKNYILRHQLKSGDTVDNEKAVSATQLVKSLADIVDAKEYEANANRNMPPMDYINNRNKWE